MSRAAARTSLRARPPRPRRAAAAPVPLPVAAPAERTRLTPEDWIAAATAVLVDQGIDRVRVDTLAVQLGVTRGSFYWHFRDRDDLLRRLLQAWSERTTEQLTRRLKGASTDATERLRGVVSLPFRGQAAAREARIELAIRAWARRDETARQAVDASDASRIAYHAQIFESLGFDAAQARHRGFLLYAYEVAESLLNRLGSAALKRERAAFVERLVQQPLES